MGAEHRKTSHALGSTLVSAAIGLAAFPQVAAEVVPERGSISFRYLEYVDRQPDLERIRISAPAVLITAPVAGAWLIDGSYVSDAVSGASPAYHTVARSAAKVTDRREAVSAGLTRYWPWGTLKVGAAYSTESDYVSRALSAQGSVSSDSKNTTSILALAQRTTSSTRSTSERRMRPRPPTRPRRG